MPSRMSDKDSVFVSITTTYKTNDNVFVSSEVGYEAHALEEDNNDLWRLYERARTMVNKMFKSRDAEVRASLGVK